MVSNAGTDIAWPGTEAPWPINAGDTATAVLIGVSANGLTNQAYPLGTAIATITATYPRVYGGTQIVSGGDTFLFSNGFADYQLRLSHCCSTIVQSAAFALKQSNNLLTPGVPLGCGVEAIFIWLAILAAGQTGLQYRFGVKLESDGGSTVLEGDLVALSNLTATTQLTKAWPEDFIGTTIAGTTLVDNDTPAGVGELNVSAFDNGQITVTVEIIDTNSPDESAVDTTGDLFDENVFALPPTDCSEGGSESDSLGE